MMDGILIFSVQAQPSVNSGGCPFLLGAPSHSKPFEIFLPCANNGIVALNLSWNIFVCKKVNNFIYYCQSRYSSRGMNRYDDPESNVIKKSMLKIL